MSVTLTEYDQISCMAYDQRTTKSVVLKAMMNNKKSLSNPTCSLDIDSRRLEKKTNNKKSSNPELTVNG